MLNLLLFVGLSPAFVHAAEPPATDPAAFEALIRKTKRNGQRWQLPQNMADELGFDRQTQALQRMVRAEDAPDRKTHTLWMLLQPGPKEEPASFIFTSYFEDEKKRVATSHSFVTDLSGNFQKGKTTRGPTKEAAGSTVEVVTEKLTAGGEALAAELDWWLRGKKSRGEASAEAPTAKPAAAAKPSKASGPAKARLAAITEACADEIALFCPDREKKALVDCLKFQRVNLGDGCRQALGR